VAIEEDGEIKLHPLRPVAVAGGLAGSYSLAQWPVLATDRRAKALTTGLWLGEVGWRRYLSGETPKAGDCLHSDQLWAIEQRVGVGLDSARLRAADGKLFTVQAVSLKPDHGFLALVEGAKPPAVGLLRWGGDGRAVAVRAVSYTVPEPDYEGIARSGRCRIVLTSPAIFPEGWRLPGMMADGRFKLLGVSGRVVCAAAPRAETVSGWDLAQRWPKAAQRMVAAGSVYWIEDLEASVDELRKLVGHGLWQAAGYDGQRRAEGFNRFAFAAY